MCRLRFTVGIDELLEDPGALLVEVTPEPALYERWHLPGAIMMPLEALYHPSRRDVAPRGLLEERLGGLGISDEDELVLYSDLGNRYAYYAFWVLWCHGNRNARVLDGGKAGWRRGLPREVEPRSRPASRFRLDDPDWSDRISMGELLSRLGDPSLRIIDARSPEEYSGREGGPAGSPVRTAAHAGPHTGGGERSVGLPVQGWDGRAERSGRHSARIIRRGDPEGSGGGRVLQDRRQGVPSMVLYEARARLPARAALRRWMGRVGQRNRDAN